jgi:hypothetical protein
MICGRFSESIVKRIELGDVEAREYVKVLHLWCGKEELDGEKLSDAMLLASVADRLEMTEVSAALEESIIRKLRVADCGNVLTESWRLGLFRVEAAARKLACEQFEEVAGTEGFVCIEEEAMGGLLDDDELGVSGEEAAFEGLVRWMKGGCEGLRGRGLLRKIRFGLIDHNYITENVRGMLPAEHADWIEDLVIEALRVRTGGRPPDLTRTSQLGEKAFVPRKSRSVPWERQCGGGGCRLQGFAGDVLALAECQGRVCGGSYDGSIRIWNRATLAQERTLHDDAGDAVHSLASWDGRLISGHEDSTIRVWDVAAGACEGVMRGHAGPVYALGVLGLRLASGSSDRSVRVWAMGPGAAWPCEATLAGHGGAVNALAAWWGRLASGSDDARIVVWDAATGEREATLTGHEDKVLGLAAHGDRLYSSSKDGTIREWAAGSWAALRTIEACGRRAARVPCCLAVSGTGLVCGLVGRRGVVNSAESFEVLVWDLDAMACEHSLAQPLGSEVWCVVAVGAEVWGGVGAEVVVWGRP